MQEKLEKIHIYLGRRKLPKAGWASSNAERLRCCSAVLFCQNLAGWAIAQSAHPSSMPVSFVVPGGPEAGLSDTNLLLYLWTISKNTRQSVWHRYLNNRNFSQSY